ncbi:MAG: prenyltransferase [Conexivisphaera sp.]
MVKAVGAMGGLRAWLLSFSPVTLTSAFSSVTLGSVLAWYATGRFNWVLYLVTLGGLLAAQAGVNLVHDYDDYATGVDGIYRASGFSHRLHPVIDLGLDPARIRAAGYALLAAALAAAVYLAAVIGIPVLVLGAIGLFLGAAYSEPPLRLHYRGLGELVAALAMGPLVVWGSYIVQTGSLAQVYPLLVGMPNGAFVFLILLGSGALEIEASRAVNKKTVVLLLGLRRTKYAALAAAALMYAALAAAALMGYLPLSSLASLALLPWTLKLLGPLLSGSEEEIRRRWRELRRLWAGPFSVRLVLLAVLLLSMVAARLLGIP